MARPLAFALEPSDVFLALLRLRAAMEVGRWPMGISARFATATDREFAALEPAVRAIGVCYSELEARRVAVVDRVPQSRFADIDGALHLAACSIDVALDLDHVRMAIARGEPSVRDDGRLLASALRQLLWYTVHSDLLMCPRMVLHGAETSPDRVIEYVDTCLASAWLGGIPPQPPTPRVIATEHTDEALAAHPPGHTALPFHEETALFPPPRRSGSPAFVDLLADTGTADPLEPGSMEPTSPSHVLAPEVHTPLAISSENTEHLARDTEHVMSGVPRRSILHRAQPSHEATVSSNQLSDEALFFLNASGVRWPCNVESLQMARNALLARTPSREGPQDAHDVARAWRARVERGYAELCGLVAR